jgi:hypothetical protein
MSTFKLEYTYDHPFNSVAAAFVRKYPHPALKHVKFTETLERYVENGKLYSERIHGSTFLSFTSVGLESIVFDREGKTIALSTKNISNRSIAVMDEDCVYKEVDGKTMKYKAKTVTKLPRGFGWLYSKIRSGYEKRFKQGIVVLEEIITKHKSQLYGGEASLKRIGFQTGDSRTVQSCCVFTREFAEILERV